MDETRRISVLTHARADHAQMVDLCARLADTRDSAMRQPLVGALARALMCHAAAEAATLYDALRALPGAGDLLADAAAEHDEIAEALADLVAMPPDAPTWGEVFAALRSVVEQHIETEEEEIFPVAEDLLSAEELLLLGEAFAPPR